MISEQQNAVRPCQKHFWYGLRAPWKRTKRRTRTCCWAWGQKRASGLRRNGRTRDELLQRGKRTDTRRTRTSENASRPARRLALLVRCASRATEWTTWRLRRRSRWWAPAKAAAAAATTLHNYYYCARPTRPCVRAPVCNGGGGGASSSPPRPCDRATSFEPCLRVCAGLLRRPPLSNGGAGVGNEKLSGNYPPNTPPPPEMYSKNVFRISKIAFFFFLRLLGKSVLKKKWVLRI